MRIELTHSCLQGRRSPIVPEKHLVREDGHYPAVTFKDTCALNPFRVPWLEHGCLFLHTLSWCLIRDSNPGRLILSQPCLPSASTRHIDQMKQSRFCSSATCFRVPRSQYLLPFAYHLCWHSHEDSNSDTRFRRPLHCPVVLCEYYWYLRRESNPQKTRILSPSHTPVLLRRYVGIPERTRTSNFTDLNRLRLPYSATRIC